MLVLFYLVGYASFMIFYLVLFFAFGSAIGSFLNVVIDRTTRRESLLGRSYCEHCKATLKTVDLIPIFSFVGLSGRCRFCKKPISWQYPIVEAITGVLFASAFLSLANASQLSLINLFYFLFLIGTLIVVAVVDFKFSLIPTTFVYLASFLSLFYNYFFLSSELFINHVLTAFGAAVFFLLIVLLTRGRGMGEGDIIFAFLIGMVLGFEKTLVSLMLSFLIGALVALLLVAVGRKKFGETVPFAPFLALGLLISLFWGERILNWYLMVY